MKKLIGLGIVGVVAIILFFSSFTTISAGYRGVLLQFGAPKDVVLNEGLQFKLPFVESIVKIDTRTQVIKFESNGDYKGLAAASKDLQDVNISIVVTYHPDAEKVRNIYQAYGLTYADSILGPTIRETVKTVSAQFTAEELVTKRTEFAGRVESILAEKFSGYSFVLEQANVVNFSFSDSFNNAIEAKVTAEQNALAAKNKLEQVKFEAQQQIETAKAQAETIKIQASAINAQGGADYVKLQWINKWNGVLPATSLGNATPLISLQ